MKKFREHIEMGSIESTKNYIDANEIDASVVYQLVRQYSALNGFHSKQLWLQ